MRLWSIRVYPCSSAANHVFAFFSSRKYCSPSGCWLLFSNELQPPHRVDHHFQQQPAVTPALDVGVAIHALAVADRQVDDFHVEMRRAEDQVEVAEGGENAE